jgi:hypothetical protein
MMRIYEGGNAIPTSVPVEQEDVPTVVAAAKREMPQPFIKRLQLNIGSAGFKIDAAGKPIPSGDIDIMVEAGDVVAVFQTQDHPKDPVLAAKKAMQTYFAAKGIEANVNGRNVSIGVVYQAKSGEQKTAQVDLMVIQDADIVAPYHQHGPRGMYSDPAFKGQANFVLMSSIAKHLGLKFDAFGAKLARRDTGEVVGRTRDEVAKILLSPQATGDDLNSLKSMIAAMANDPDRDAKLAQARGDAAKGLITLPESRTNSPADWFRNITKLL